MNIYVFTDIDSNRVSVIHATSLDGAWEKYIQLRLPEALADVSLKGMRQSISDIRKDLEPETIVNSDVEYII